MSLGKRWMIAVVQTSGWSLPEPGLKPPRLCTPPASWLQQSTAPSSDSSRGRTWAGHTQLLSTCLLQHCSEHRQCDHSPGDHEARIQPGEASWSDLQRKAITCNALKEEGWQYSMYFCLCFFICFCFLNLTKCVCNFTTLSVTHLFLLN